MLVLFPGTEEQLGEFYAAWQGFKATMSMTIMKWVKGDEKKKGIIVSLFNVLFALSLLFLIGVILRVQRWSPRESLLLQL